LTTWPLDTEAIRRRKPIPIRGNGFNYEMRSTHRRVFVAEGSVIFSKASLVRAQRLDMQTVATTLRNGMPVVDDFERLSSPSIVSKALVCRFVPSAIDDSPSRHTLIAVRSATPLFLHRDAQS
jgi:hypothetical protein